MYPTCSRNLNTMLREMENMKKTQIECLQMRNTVSEMRKKTLDGIISRLETTEENIS